MSDENRRRPEISITPDRQDLVTERRGRRTEPARQSHFNGLLVFVIALMAIVMGIGGYALYEANNLLIEGQKNIEELDARLAATGTDVSKTLQTIQNQIKQFSGQMEASEHEIRKLWDVANKRNKDWIKANEAAIGVLNKKMVQVEALLKKVGESVSELESAIEDERASLALIEGRILDQTDQMNLAKRQLGIMEKQLKDINEAIKAIDQHRIQVNQEIRFLRDSILTEEAAKPGG